MEVGRPWANLSAVIQWLIFHGHSALRFLLLCVSANELLSFLVCVLLLCYSLIDVLQLPFLCFLSNGYHKALFFFFSLPCFAVLCFVCGRLFPVVVVVVIIGERTSAPHTRFSL